MTNNLKESANEKIKIRSLFNGWINITYEKALEWSKYKLLAITTGANDIERLKMINNRLQGVKFTLEQLQ